MNPSENISVESAQKVVVVEPENPKLEHLNKPKKPRVFVGARFEKWTVKEYDKPYFGTHKWWCVCECGNLRSVLDQKLIHGRSSACKPCSKKRHGKCYDRIWRVWASMINRCLNPKCPKYKDYGGRGITVDPLWIIFENFYADMGDVPFKDAELDRIDNEAGYTKSNCRWVTRLQQMQNTRLNRRITFDGRTEVFNEWCRILGMKQGTLFTRINRLGWSIEKAFTTPVRHGPC